MNQKVDPEEIVEFTPLEKIESLYYELLKWYGEAEQKELRVAAKLLMVALDKFATHDPQGWHQLVDEYVAILKQDPEKFQKMLESNRGESKRDGVHSGLQ